MTQHEISSPPPLDLSRRATAAAMAILLTLSAGLLTKQIANAKVASKDACAYYLPLARAWAAGDSQHRQHVMIPPLQPALVGLTAKLFDSDAHHLEFIARCLSAASMLGLVVVVYYIGRTTFSRRVGIAAAALTAAHPYLIRFGATVGPDMLYAFVLATLILSLLVYARRPRGALALAAGLTAGLCGLIRGEGSIMIAPALAVIILANWRKGISQRWQAALHAGVLLILVAVLWMPRIAYVYSQSGYPVLDVRMTTFLQGGTRSATQSALRVRPLEVAHVPDEPPAATLQNTEFWDELLESPRVFGLAAIPAGLYWFLARRRLPRLGAIQIIVGAIILIELLLVGRVKLGSRYLITIVGPLQLWGALGIIEFAEALRPFRSVAGRLGRSLAAQCAGLAMIVVCMTIWSVMLHNADTDGFDQRQAGEYVLAAGGEGRRLMCTSPQTPYYANGDYVAVVPVKDSSRTLTAAALRDAIARFAVDYVVYSSDENWSSWLAAHAEKSAALRQSFRILQGRNTYTTYVLEARALWSELEGATALETPPVSGSMTTAPAETTRPL